MALVQTRGGFPAAFHAAIDDTGRVHQFPFRTREITFIACDGPVKVYFSEDDYTNDENYLIVPAVGQATPWGCCSGPYTVERVWLKAANAGETYNVSVYAWQQR